MDMRPRNEKSPIKPSDIPYVQYHDPTNREFEQEMTPKKTKCAFRQVLHQGRPGIELFNVPPGGLMYNNSWPVTENVRYSQASGKRPEHYPY